jgi:hypothetical protein
MKNINEDLIKRSLLYMNYDSKKTLNENLQLLNEETTVTGADYLLKLKTPSPGGNSPGTARITKGSKITKNGDFINVDSKDVSYNYNCTNSTFQAISKSGIPMIKTMWNNAIYTSDSKDLTAILDTKFCKNVVVGGGNKGNDNMASDKYWGALLERLKDAGYQFKSGVTSGTNLPVYWLGPFIIYRYGSNFITYTKGDSSGNAKISSTSYKGKYAGQVITDILLSTNVVRFTGESPNLKEWIDYLNPTKEKTPEKTKDWEDSGGVRNDPGKDRKPKPDYTPGGGSKPKNECKGTYSMGCITPEVGEAQQCLKDDGLYPYRVDNKFGSKTRDAVKAKIGKTYFTDADLQTICKTKKGGGGDDEYDFDKDMGGGSGQQEKEDTTWTGDVY